MKTADMNYAVKSLVYSGDAFSDSPKLEASINELAAILGRIETVQDALHQASCYGLQSAEMDNAFQFLADLRRWAEKPIKEYND